VEGEERSNGSTRTFMLGFLIGAVGAAAASLLYAPRSGEETKAQIRWKADGLRNGARETIERGRKSAGNMVSDAGITVADWLQEGSRLLKEEAAELRHEVRTNEAKPE
jgi:gas vesicle protein